LGGAFIRIVPFERGDLPMHEKRERTGGRNRPGLRIERHQPIEGAALAHASRHLAQPVSFDARPRAGRAAVEAPSAATPASSRGRGATTGAGIEGMALGA
jgi:hypothetical protein